ncbi:hypothetical protein Cni_G02021 [Canna indica]|uniref:Uncharacterized protein n=1 Tax=Canna indica TaxID=4628 RepID=A0AAQ3Q1U6_9LILI|nr:hypothetical protein Cni_G02021 [Canna indica]
MIQSGGCSAIAVRCGGACRISPNSGAWRMRTRLRAAARSGKREDAGEMKRKDGLCARGDGKRKRNKAVPR